MPFVEVFVPRNTLTAEQRDQLHQELVATVMAVEGAPDTAAARSISWMVLNEVDSWSVGGEVLGAGAQPLIVVRISMPAGSLDDDKRSRMMDEVIDVLVRMDGSERYRQHPHAWVHINDVLDGNWGALGRVVGLSDIRGFIDAAAV